MKKLSLIFLLFITHCLPAIFLEGSLFIGYAQQPTQEWVRRYTDTSSVNWGGHSIKMDSLGYIYVLTETSNDFGFLKYDRNGNLLLVVTHWPGGYPNGGGTYFDVTPEGNVYITGDVSIDFYEWIYTVKFNTNGVFQWGKFYNIDNSDGANDIKIDNSGNIIIAGGSLVGNTNFALLIKYNSIGDTLWTKHFNNGQNDAVFYKLVFDNANNIYLTGYLKLPSKCLVMKYRPNGNLDWFTTFSNDTNFSHIGHGISLDLSGNIYVSVTAVVPFSGLNDYLIKLTNNGNLLWSRVFTGILNIPGLTGDSPRGPAISSDGNSIYFSTMVDNGLGGGSYSVATIKYNSVGDSQWVKVYDGGGIPGANRVAAIKLDKNNNIYLCGSGYFSTSGDDFISIKYSPLGVQQWVMTYAGEVNNGGDHSQDLQVDTSLDVYVIGNSPNLHNASDAVIIKYDQLIGINPQVNGFPVRYELMQNYPNPFNPSTMFKFEIPKAELIKIVICDILGREVAILVNEKLNPGTCEANWNAGNCSSGVYFYTLVSETYRETKKAILIK